MTFHVRGERPYGKEEWRMSLLVEVLLTIAILIFFYEKARSAVRYLESRQMRRWVRRYDDLHHAATMAIMDDFELWWDDIANATLRAIVDKFYAGTRFRAPSYLLDILDPIVEQQFVLPLRAAALHLAIHTRLRPSQEAFLAQCPKRVRAALEAYIEKHNIGLERDQLRLYVNGVSYSELEKRFSPS
jgi:hypothetical protein